MASLSHSFSVEHAAKFGIEQALLINHFAFWVHQNRECSRHLHEGRTWMYQTLDDIASVYPYWKRGVIERAINALVKDGILRKGNFNGSKYDRTVWYAFEEEEKFVPESKNKISISRNQEMVIPNSRNRVPENETPIPDTNTDTNTDKKHTAPPAGVAPPEIQKNSLSPTKKKFKKGGDPRLVAHGDLVRLLPEQYAQLCAERGKANVDRLISKMNFTLLAKGQSYKNYFMALNSWFLNSWNQPNGGKEVIQNRDPNAYREPDVDASGDVIGPDGKWYDKKGNLLTEEFLEAEERAKEEAKKLGKSS